jgi:RNA polymerase sigma-70 factor (ECF subfamily)
MAEDLEQEVFMKIWESRKQLREVKSFRAYLFIVARNHILNTLKAVFRSDAAMGEVVNHFIRLRNAQADSGNTPENDLLSKEYQTFLEKILTALPERTREIFRLCREQGKTYDEVAALLGISRNAVKNHMVHSMKILGGSVEKDLGISLSLFLAIMFH